MQALQQIKFFINNEEQIVRVSNFPQDTTLNQFLRNYANLTGTKKMCLEGGCGSCVVSVTKKNSLNDKNITLSINSCLVSLFSCNDWKIETVEGIGNQLNGYHHVQKVLTEKHGTQCGYCTPGMIMNMYALSKENPNFTKQNVEDSFSGNLCRCTGYRPILDAFKSLCNDECRGKLLDIEDLPICSNKSKKYSVTYNFQHPKWYTASNIGEIFQIFAKDLSMSYKLIGGNTAKGVYKENKNYDVYINISNVKELVTYEINDNCIVLGAGITLNDCMNFFYEIGNKRSDYSYLINVADHISLVANVPVRNVGTIGGNLNIKHQHHEFPSDIFLLLETVDAKLTIVDQQKEITLSLMDYLDHNMRHSLIKNIIIYPYDNHLYKFNSFKIMPRAQNAHALLQAGFLIKLEKDIVMDARIIYGCINDKFVHAKSTETYLLNKHIFDNNVLQGAYKSLIAELKPTCKILDSSPEFRIKLAISLFYKFILGIAPIISERNKSGALKLIRPLSSGKQEFSTNKNLYPLTEPIRKIEALSQTSGEAQFITDMPDLPDQLYAAFVLAEAPANSVILAVDPSKALEIDGVVAYFDKNDIPGENNFTPKSLYPIKEELFCSGIVQYYSQPIGIVVAETQELAERASQYVQVKYQYSEEKPLLKIREVLEAGRDDRLSKKVTIEPKTQGHNVKYVLRSEFDIGYQYHFHLENQCCNVIPTEDGFDMYPSTQQMDTVQAAAAAVLNLPANKFNISVRRIGGAYGAKISRNAICSSAAVLACYKLGKPIKLWLPLNVNMKVIGKRFPCSANYDIGINEDGKIQYLNMNIYSDYGVGGNDDALHYISEPMQSVYDTTTWKISGYSVKTDTPAGTWCRAPGSLESYAVIESIMDYIAHTINKDPLEVRLLNMNSEKTKYLKEYISELESWADINARKKEIVTFNKNNRWVKKGISVTPNIYTLYPLAYWPVIVTIYHIDGTVSVSHAGIEIGQGINTKAMQVCAYALRIPMEKVSIKPSNNLIGPNALYTGASITSESVCLGVLKACEILLKRMEPIKRKIGQTSWENLIEESYKENVNLTAHFLSSGKCPEIQKYNVFLVCATEVEVDILTGNHLIKRVDILEDVGNSISPSIDIGQVEGAFLMGQGYWTTEEIKLSEDGEILTDNTWTYKVPGIKDIPIDFRVKFSNYNPNPVGILNTKAVSEPPLTMSCSIPLAIKSAVASAREEINQERWCKIDGPTNVENTFLSCLHDSKYYTL